MSILWVNRDMTFEDIIKDKVVFKDVKFSKETVKEIWKVKPKVIKGVPKVLESLITKDIVSSLDDPDLIELVKDFKYDFNRMVKGDYVPYHTEVSRISPIEIIAWFFKEDFQGREFVYYMDGTKTEIKPENNRVCFLYTHCPDGGHEVKDLLSDTQVITITGGLGGQFDTNLFGDTSRRKPGDFKEVHITQREGMETNKECD